MKTAPAGIPYPIDERRERIATAALEEFVRRGFALARESVIARRAGVSLATLRRYFATKDDLFREVVRATVATVSVVEEPATTDGAPAPSAVARLQDFAHRFWRVMEQPGPSALLRMSIGELPRFRDLALFHANEVIGRAARTLECTLRQGTMRGELRPTDERVVARVILSALVTHAHWFALPGIYAGITGTDRERDERAVVGLMVNALQSPAT